MNKTDIIEKTRQFVQRHLQNDCTGHDWWHVYRVWKMAKYIAEVEHADLFVVELAALLHDIADWKFNHGDEEAGPNLARQWMLSLCVDIKTINEVCDIILNISFKGAGVQSILKNVEGCVVQDADRLDAIGAVGIARVFAFGGAFSQPMYDPELSVVLHNSFESYKNKKTTSINHFYEKLLLLKDRMNTDTGKKLAEQRHQFMTDFLDQFHRDWNSNFAFEITESTE